MQDDISYSHPTISLTLIITIFITGALAFVQVYSIQAILPVLMQDFAVSAPVAGATVGATVLAVAVMSPFMGMMSDALGRKVFIVGSVLFITLPTLALAFVQDIGVMWWLRFIQGLGVPGITVVLIAYISEEFTGSARTKLMTFYVSGTVMGGFLGRFLMGYLTEFMGWRHAFLVMGGLSVLGTLMVWRYLPKSTSFVAKPHISDAFRTLWHHLHNRHVLAACALGFCVLFSLVGCFTYINLYLDQPPYHLSSAQLANIFAVYLIGMVITPISAQLIIKLGANRTVLLAMGISISGLLLTLLPWLWLIVLALAIMSSGIFITQSSTINYISFHVDEGRSLASGLYYMTYYSGGFVGAWLCGHSFELGGWKLTVFTLVAVQLIGMLVGGLCMAKKTALTPDVPAVHH
ncbi:MFS transporter [Neisseriaceae bacterium ESL0693]|nr:MFS transporter [Neisseriaceae bacterium ESL0693]